MVDQVRGRVIEGLPALGCHTMHYMVHSFPHVLHYGWSALRPFPGCNVRADTPLPRAVFTELGKLPLQHTRPYHTIPWNTIQSSSKLCQTLLLS